MRSRRLRSASWSGQYPQPQARPWGSEPRPSGFYRSLQHLSPEVAVDSAVRTTRKPQGNRPLVQERDAYFLLVDQGMSFAEAARAVGISTRTGERWRNGRGASGRIKAYPPLNAAPVDVSSDPSRYLREADRVHMADRLLEKATIRAIAAELGRSPSTISRKVRRNGTIGWSQTDR
ncbi:helix-turn-helix domain-containing protein [Streptomyces cacaoi]|uniref:helix-turn-helix domain-containing protein n=1 Tax=Streptomyces cacaoi TaxID=1898 RepID=UPI003749DDD9